jgi:hypothetical protein
MLTWSCCNNHTCIHKVLFVDTAAAGLASSCSFADWVPVCFNRCCISGRIICITLTAHVTGARSTVGRLYTAESLQDQNNLGREDLLVGAERLSIITHSKRCRASRWAADGCNKDNFKMCNRWLR